MQKCNLFLIDKLRSVRPIGFGEIRRGLFLRWQRRGGGGGISIIVHPLTKNSVLDNFNAARNSEFSQGVCFMSLDSLYRIVQEALNNVLKHAGAQNVSVLLQKQDGHLSLIIEDDGRGFDPDQDTIDTTSHKSGLIGMGERAALLNGKLEIDSSPGAGTTVHARIPIEN